MTTRPKPPTIREVAALAGVSTATVSRAMRGYPNVDPVTHRRVMNAIGELGYRPSGVARSLKSRSTRTLGLIVTDIQNPYFPQIVSAVEDTARSYGYSVILADGRGDPDREVESLEVLTEREVDGLIIASTALTARHEERIHDLRCPVVIVNGASPLDDVPAVFSDNEAGGALAAGHLLELGHRNLAFIASRERSEGAVTARLAGVRSAIEAMGAVSASLVVVEGSVEVAGGMEAAEKVLEQDRRVTGIVCANDLVAVGAILAVRQRGATVPGDISVVGFDDIQIAAHVDPPLTTVRQATDEMGHWAVGSLMSRLAPAVADSTEDFIDGPITKRLPVRLVERASTAPVRRLGG